MSWGQKRKGKRGSGWGWGGGGDGEAHYSFSGIIGGIVEVVAGGVLRAGKDSYEDDSAGWWIGRAEDGSGKINFGNENYSLKWTGTSLDVVGKISGSITELILAAGGAIHSGKATFADTTAGFWLGDHLLEPKFSVGDADEGITWDGSALGVVGAIGGSITDLLLSATGAVRAVKSSYSDTTAGWWLGMDSGTPKLNIGNASYSLKWTGVALEVLGSIGGVVSNLVVSSNGAIRSGKTVFGDMAAGWWIGMDGGDPKIDIGAAQDHLQWDGSALDVTGAIGGTITALVLQAVNSAVRAGKTTYSDTTAGFWLGLDTTTPKFNIGDATNYVKWNGTALDIAGAIGGTISGLVMSAANSFIRAGKTSYADTAAGYWLGLSLGTPVFHIGNATNYVKWTGTVLQVVGAISGKITDLQLSDNGVQVRAGKTSFADTTAGFWLGVSAGGHPQFHIGNATSFWKFDASASPPITYHWTLDGADLDPLSVGTGALAAGAVTAAKMSVSALNTISTSMGDLDIDGTLTIAEYGSIEGGEGKIWITRDGYHCLVQNPGGSAGVRFVSANGVVAGITASVIDGAGQAEFGARGDSSTYDEAILYLSAGTYDDDPHDGSEVVGITLDTALEQAKIFGGSGRTLEVALISSYVEMDEITAPSAPAGNQARLYCIDNGLGKTQLCVRFSSGAVQVLATQP